MALADQQLGFLEIQPGMERGTRGSLDAMIRPENLRPISEPDRFERLAARMRRGERGMAARMPVLREHHVFEARREPVDDRHHLVAPRTAERAARHEVVLHVDDEQARTARGQWLPFEPAASVIRSACSF